jgi:hypothetical protein
MNIHRAFRPRRNSISDGIIVPPSPPPRDGEAREQAGNQRTNPKPAPSDSPANFLDGEGGRGGHSRPGLRFLISFEEENSVSAFYSAGMTRPPNRGTLKEKQSFKIRAP